MNDNPYGLPVNAEDFLRNPADATSKLIAHDTKNLLSAATPLAQFDLAICEVVEPIAPDLFKGSCDVVRDSLKR